MRYAFFIALLLNIMLSTCACDRAKTKPYIGPQAAKVLVNPTRVQTFRIEYIGISATQPAPSEMIDGFRLLTTGSDRDADFGRRITKLAVASANVKSRITLNCEFEPGVLFRVWSDNEFVDVLLCFKCNQVGVWVPDENGTVGYQAEILMHDSKSFRELAKEAFPEDAAFQ